MTDQYEQTRDLVDKITALLKEGKCADARKLIKGTVQSCTDEVFGVKVMESVMENISAYDSSNGYDPKKLGEAIIKTYILELDLAGRTRNAETAREWYCGLWRN